MSVINVSKQKIIIILIIKVSMYVQKKFKSIKYRALTTKLTAGYEAENTSAPSIYYSSESKTYGVPMLDICKINKQILPNM